MDYDPVRRGFAEFVGTFTLVFIGAGSILTFGKLFAGAFAAGSGSQVAGLGLVAVALAHGLAIGVMVSAVGHISGGHFNPAITLGFLVTRRLAPILALVYWVVQLTAAVAAAALLHWLFTMSERNAVQLGAPLLGSGITQWQGLVIEIVLTFFLVWVVFATAADPRRDVQVDRRTCDRPHDHARHPHGRAADGRGDEPGARVRAGADPERLDERVDLLRGTGDRRRGRRGLVRVALPAADAADPGRAARDGRDRAAAGRHGRLVSTRASY